MRQIKCWTQSAERPRIKTKKILQPKPLKIKLIVSYSEHLKDSKLEIVPSKVNSCVIIDAHIVDKNARFFFILRTIFAFILRL